MKLHTLVLGDLSTNCYVVADEETREAMVVDAPAHSKKILDFLKEQNYTLKEIVLTHGHFDHILALKELQQATGAPIAIHQNGETFLKDSLFNLCHYVGIRWTPVQPQRLLNDGDTLSVGNMNFQVLHTPGHTSDCICLFGEGILISGDTLFSQSVGRVDHPTGSLAEEVQSIQEKLMILPDETPVYPGHGPATTIGAEREWNPYLQ